MHVSDILSSTNTSDLRVMWKVLLLSKAFLSIIPHIEYMFTHE